MVHRQLRRVQINAWRRRAAVKRVSENRKTAVRRVDPNLMRPPSQRLGFNLLAANLLFCILHSSFCLP